jgi:hypothetical protein
VGVGIVADFYESTPAFGAWQDGVVGDFGGGEEAYTWTQSAAVIQALPDGEDSLDTALDVSSDGGVIVGDSSLGAPGVNAVYWDAAGRHILDPSVGIQSQTLTVSPNAEFIGGWIGYFDAFFNPVIQATVWDGNRDVVLLTDAGSNPFQGKVLDVSDHGYAVGQTLDGKGFIWHESFAEPLIFDDWLETKRVEGDPILEDPSTSVVAVAEDTVNGKLLFAVNGSAYFVQVDAPELIPQWHNSDMPLDATGDGLISPLDALVIINALNTAVPARCPHRALATSPTTPTATAFSRRSMSCW